MSGWGRGGQRHLLATAFLFWHLAAVGWAASWSLAKGPPIRNSPQHVAISAKLGGQVRITCPVHSDPEPIVEWYREGERVKEYSDRYRLSELSLVIKQFECDDEGTYVCKAINGFGTTDDIVFILEIERSKDNNCRQQDEDEVSRLDDDSGNDFPVISQLRKSEKHLLKPAGSQVSIKCSATGKASLTIRWFKDSVEINRWNKKYTIKETTSRLGRIDSDEVEDDEEDGSRRQVVRSELEIANVTRSDMANYTCRAANDFYGTADLTIFLEVVERQEPRDPELHPQYPVNSSFAAGQLASLSCKAKSEFPPELHWLKRLSDSSPPLDGDVEVGVDPRNTVFDNMTPNKTISYGNARYLILPSPKPVMVDGYYLSKLTFAKVNAETDAGVYVCVVFNDSGFTHRVVNLTVFDSPNSEGGSTETGSAVTNSAMSEVDSTTTAVVIFVVIVGLGTMVAVCLAWKRRSKHVKDNFLSGVAAPKSSSTSSVSVQITRDPQPLPASENGTLSSPVTYPIFRDGLCGAELASSREASGASYGPVLNQANGETVYYFNGRSSRRNNPPRRSHRSPRGPRASHRHRGDDFHKRRIPPMTAPPRGSLTSEEMGVQLPITWEKRSARLARPSPESSFDNGILLL